MLNTQIGKLNGGSRMNGQWDRDFSEDFVEKMRERVKMSYFKYGPASKNFGEGRVDALATAEDCIFRFKKDKNTEHLIDAANYLMFRYAFPMPGETFRATDDSESVKPVGTPVNFERGD